MRRGRGRLALAVALLLTQGTLGATCVEGVTPECSDPAARCGPQLDATTDQEASLSEASTDAEEAGDAADAGEAGDAGDGGDGSSDGDAASDAPDGG